MANLIRLTNVSYDHEWSEEKQHHIPKNTESDVYINPDAIASIGLSDAFRVDDNGEYQAQSHTTIFCHRELQYYVKESLEEVILLFQDATR